jgi:AraC-like DNA-binding protein
LIGHASAVNIVTIHSAVVPLMNHQVFRSRDYDETCTFLQKKELGFSAIKERSADHRLDARINAVYLPNMYISYTQYGVPVEISACSSRGDYALYVPVQGQIESVIGNKAVSCRQGEAVVASPLRDQSTLSSAECGRFILSIARDTMVRQLAALLGHSVTEALVFDPQINLSNGDGRILMDAIELAVRDFDRAGSMLWNPIMTAQFEQWIATGLLLSQSHNYSGALRKQDRSVAPKDVIKAIDYIHANLHLPITLSDIVAASGIPGRTLYKHFQDFKGIPPLAYVRKSRIERAREELLRSNGDATVTEIAARWGFEHPGRFSVEYRKRFGERPSETLARPGKTVLC